MSGHREVGGVAVAFAGFAFLVLAFKGTWHDVYNAALGKSSSSSTSSTGSTSGTRQTVAQGFPGGAPPYNPLAERRT